MEKKLTDEEIVRAFVRCHTIDVEEACQGCPLDEGSECLLGNGHWHERRIIDLIQRQKAEIERLTKTLEVADKAFEKQAEEIKTLKLACVDKIQRNEELQKQVDELKERYLEESKERCKFEQLYEKKCHEHNIGAGVQRSHWEKKVQQSVKDTAKEIYSLMIGEYECYIPTDIAEEIAKRYGVEVE